MADRFESFDVEAPANTAAASPTEVDTAFDPGVVERITVVIPDGHAGLTGIAIAYAHQPVIPFNRRAKPTSVWKFIEGNDEVINWDVENQLDGGAWSCWVYNTDIQAHYWQIRFEVRSLGLGEEPTAVAPTPLQVNTEGQLAVSTPETTVTGSQPETAPITSSPAPGAPEAPPSPAETEPPAEPAPAEPPAEAAPTPPAAPGETPEPVPPVEPAPPGEPAPEVEPAPPPEGPEAGEPPEPKGRQPGRPSRQKYKVVVHRETRPAGGWLPAGARYTEKRTDQGQDFITDWRGKVVAPGNGHVVHNLSDKPFPNGFGHSYCVVHIDTGGFAGHDWYIGHCTSAVHAGQHFKDGDVLAHADQGHVEGGGWVELGEAPGGHPAPMGTGKKWHHLFVPRTTAHTTRVRVKTRSYAPPKHGKEPPAHRPGEKPRKPPSHGKGAPPKPHGHQPAHGYHPPHPAAHKPPGHAVEHHPVRKPPRPPAHHENRPPPHRQAPRPTPRPAYRPPPPPPHHQEHRPPPPHGRKR